MRSSSCRFLLPSIPAPDTLSGADLTTMEESNEFIGRLNDKLAGNRDAPPLPQFTSCCPGWVGKRGRERCQGGPALEAAYYRCCGPSQVSYPSPNLQIMWRRKPRS